MVRARDARRFDLGGNAVILLVGAVGSGKRTFARGRLGVLADAVDDAVLGQGSAVARAQELVRDPATDLTRLADALAGRSVVMVDQVGYGVVPIDPDERAWRERAGRLSCELALRADTVVRLVCGCPQVIKGEL